MPHPDLNYPALRAAALALKEAIADFGEPQSTEASSVLGFVSHALPIQDAIHGRVSAPIDRQPNPEKGLDGALQGYPALERPYYALSSQLYGVAAMKREAEVLRKFRERHMSEQNGS